MVQLPIEPLIPEIRTALDVVPNLVLEAPPGAGKTTLVPLALLEAGWVGLNRAGLGKIIVLEPRRLAARAAAHRMSAILGQAVGETVGYRVRLDRRIGPEENALPDLLAESARLHTASAGGCLRAQAQLSNPSSSASGRSHRRLPTRLMSPPPPAAPRSGGRSAPGDHSIHRGPSARRAPLPAWRPAAASP